MVDKNILKKRMIILNRINNFSELFSSSISLYFDRFDLEIINILVKEGKLKYVWSEENEQKLIVTSLGKQVLFCYNNTNLIMLFYDLLEKKGYNNDFDIIMKFLFSQDLDMEPYEILTIENYENFARVNNIDITLEKKVDNNNSKKMIKVLELSYDLRNSK